MSFENTAGLGVNNHYGQRDTVSGAGGFTSSGPDGEIEIILDEASLSDGFLPSVTMYAGTVIEDVTVVGDTLFVSDVGTAVEIKGVTTPANKITLSEAELETAAGAVASGAGTAAGEFVSTAVTTADDTLTVAVSAGAVTTYGRLIVRIKTRRVV